MSFPDLPWDGGCRCNALRFRLTAFPLLTMACHCTGCQRMTGGAYSLSTLVPAETFEITQGEPVHGGLPDGEIEHMFCPSCMSWVFTRVMGGAFVNIRSTMFDDTSPAEPFIESYTSEKLPWAVTTAVHSFARFPAPEDYGKLIEEFAAIHR